MKDGLLETPREVTANPRGGKREGSGRKPGSPRPRRSVRASDEEWAEIKALLRRLRGTDDCA